MIDRYHYTQDELGKVIGKAQNTLSETLQINTLPQKIKEEYRAPDTQKISKTVLIEITRLKTPEEQLRLWDIVKTGQFTSRQVRAKKHQTTTRTDAEHTKLTLSVGRKFIRTLEKVSITSLVPNHDSHRELIKIQERINELIEKISEQER